jgi:hypothetical protein
MVFSGDGEEITFRMVSTDVSLKVPKRENFSLAFFALSEPIWACDSGTGKKSNVYQLTTDLDGFWFFDAYCVCGKQHCF